MPRRSGAVVTANEVFAAARKRLRSPLRSGQCISRAELADAVNRALDGMYPDRDLTSLYVDFRWVGKLERGESRWPVEERRSALREVFGVTADIELGLYSPRRTETVEPVTPRAEVDAIVTGPVQYNAPRWDPAVLDESDRDSARWAGRKGVDVDRRTFLASSVIGAGLGLAGRRDNPSSPMTGMFVLARTIGSVALNLDDLDRFQAVVRDARRYTDSTVVGYLDDVLERSASDDGILGPRYALPAVLGLIAVVQHAAREAKPAMRRPLLAVGARAAEFAGWLYRDSGQSSTADYWRDRASEWGMEASDFAMSGYVLIKKAQSAWDERDAGRMLGLTQAVQEGPWQLPARVMAEAVQQQARGLAMLKSSRRKVDDQLKKARELLELDSQDKTPLAAHYDATLFKTQTAICYGESERPEEAVEIYESTLTPAMFSARDYAYFSTLKAQTLVAAARPDDAATTGAAALGGAFAAGSTRTVREISRLRDRLEPWRGRPAVDEFMQLVEAHCPKLKAV